MTVVGEVLHWKLIGDRQRFGSDALHYALYHLTYLNMALIAAVTPMLLVAVLAPNRKVWLAGLIASVFSSFYVGFAVFHGRFHEWEALMSAVRILDFAAIIGILTVWGLVVLRKAEVDIYFAAFLAIETLFLFMVPIQEAFFELVGLDAAREMPGVHQVAQLLTTSIQLMIVVAALRLISRGVVLPRLRLGGAL